MLNRRRVERLAAETAREMGILLIVLAPLEAAFANHVVDWKALTLALVIGAVLIVCSILTEAQE